VAVKHSAGNVYSAPATSYCHVQVRYWSLTSLNITQMISDTAVFSRFLAFYAPAVGGIKRYRDPYPSVCLSRVTHDAAALGAQLP